VDRATFTQISGSPVKGLPSQISGILEMVSIGCLELHTQISGCLVIESVPYLDIPATQSVSSCIFSQIEIYVA